MRWGGDQVVGRGVDTPVCSIVVVWAPSRGGNSSIGSYSLKIVGGMGCGGQIQRRVVQEDGEGIG